MATPTKSTTAPSVGVEAGPESSVILKSTNIDVSGSVEFALIGPCESVEVSIVSATAKTGTPSVVFSLDGYNEGSDTWEVLITSAALTDASSTFLAAGQNVAAVANHSAANRLVRKRMRVTATYTGTPVTDLLNGVTYTVHAI